jgi:hypothetical protein
MKVAHVLGALSPNNPSTQFARIAHSLGWERTCGSGSTNLLGGFHYYSFSWRRHFCWWAALGEATEGAAEGAEGTNAHVGNPNPSQQPLRLEVRVACTTMEPLR